LLVNSLAPVLLTIGTKLDSRYKSEVDVLRTFSPPFFRVL
jgi:hypothetical protein